MRKCEDRSRRGEMTCSQENQSEKVRTELVGGAEREIWEKSFLGRGNSMRDGSETEKYIQQ